MRWPARLRLRLRSLFLKGRVEQEPDEELRYQPFDQAAFNLIVRTRQEEPSPFPRLTGAIREVRPGLLVQGQTTMVERIDRLPLASRQRSSAWLARGAASVNPIEVLRTE
jgi:hypothetical protein